MLKKFFPYLIVTAIVCLSVGVYWNSLNNDFVNMDDLDLIVRNKYIKALNFQNIKDIFTPGVVGAYQPVRTLSYLIDYHFWRLNPTGYHITNIFCHACSTLLVFLIAYTLAKNFTIACLSSLFFAVHPVHVEAVTWLSGRRDVLSLAFALLSFYCFLKFLNSGVQKRSFCCKISDFALLFRCLLPPAFFYSLSLLFFTLGLLTKPSVVILPLLLVLYDICFLSSLRLPLRRSLSRAKSRDSGQDSGQALYQKWRRVLYYIPFFLVAFGFTRVFVSLSRTSGVAKASYHGGEAYITLLTMLRVFAEYIYMLFAPRHLSLTYGVRAVLSVWDMSFLIAVGVLAIVFVLTILAWKRARIVFFGICWFFIALIPVSNIIPIAVVKADRYLYLPSVGFCLAIAWIVTRCWAILSCFGKEDKTRFVSSKTLLAVGYWLMVGIVVVSYAFLTIRRNRDWKDSHTLWTATLETTPTSTIALNNLGLIYVERGMYDKAITLYEQLLIYDPNQDQVERVYRNIANAYTGKQMFDQAIEYYQKSLEANPEYIEAYIGLAKVTMELEQYEKAVGIYQYAIEIDPQNETLYNQLGNLYFVQGEYDEAATHYQKAIELNPFYIVAYNGLGLSYAGKGEIDNALSIYQQALQIDPDTVVIRNSLGSLYMAQGEVGKAIVEFQESLSHDPDNAEVRNNLGVLFLQTGRYKEALGEFMASLKLQPENPMIISNLGIAYTHVGLYDEAIQMYRWALQIDPSLFQTHVLLGDVCLGTGQVTCAIEAYQNALEFQPNNQKLLEKLQLAREQQSANQ